MYISKVVLGCALFGDQRWQPWLLGKEQALPLLEYAWKQGINTWDTVSWEFDGFNYEFLAQDMRADSDCSGRCVLEWTQRRDSRGSHQEVSDTPRRISDHDQDFLCAGPCQSTSDQFSHEQDCSRSSEPSWLVSKAHTRCSRRIDCEAGNIY